MSLITTLSLVRTAAHAVTIGTNRNEVDFLVRQGLLVKGTRSCAGKVFTKDTMRSFIDEVIKGYSSGHILSVLKVIKNAPSSVTKGMISNTAVAGIGTVDARVNTLFNAGLIKQHRRKAGYYFTNPDKRDLINALLSEVQPVSTPAPTATPASFAGEPVSNNGYALSGLDKAILAKIKSAPASVRLVDVCPPATGGAEAALSIGFMMGLGLVRQHSKKPGYYFTEPTKASLIASLIAPPAPATPVVPEGEPIPTDAVLALCRLSEHGVSMRGIWNALQKLISEGVIRADKRDDNKKSKDVRYFVRKGGPRMGDIRAQADKRVAALIVKNDSLVDLVNEAVDNGTGAGF